MIESAGRVANGLVGHPIFTRRYIDEVVRPALNRGASHTSRSVEDVMLAGYVICSIHDDAAVARSEAKAQIAFYSVVRTYSAIFELHGYGAETAQIRSAWKQRDLAGMIAAVPEELVDLMAVTGTPSEVRDRFKGQFADLYDHSMLYSPSFGISAERFADNLSAIIETFRRRP